MSARRFVTLDVFTTEPLKGNPLAVVLDSEGLDDARMQKIAAEFNLSETVFVFPPENTRHKAALRIFTPGAELPFAGHPTVGAAVLLALRAAEESGYAGPQAFALEERAGLVTCAAEPLGAGLGRARFRAPGLPRVTHAAASPAAIAAALGLDAGEIGFGAHAPSAWGVAKGFAMAPVASLDALARVRPNDAAIRAVAPEDHAAIYAYTRVDMDLTFRARMFAPGLGIVEDPATGSAAASFAGALMQFEKLGDGAHDVVIHQGVEMGRDSRIDLHLMVEGGKLIGVEIGGEAVVVSEGTLRL
ncbi:MAG: PhzF family phenazine biosynthesis protein [Alphaproteobacteria bacterium]|nr:PhzF family phenazine biosynthesis protein [Alphaproteobacteria bacterium]